MTRQRKKDHEWYISNKEMFAEVIKCQEEDKISDKLAKMFMLMAKRYATKPSFNGYSYKDEMIDAAVVDCCAALHKFNSEKGSNTFAYYTSIIHNAFLGVLKKEKTQQEIRDALLVENEMTPSFAYQEKYGSIHSTQLSDDIDMSESNDKSAKLVMDDDS